MKYVLSFIVFIFFEALILKPTQIQAVPFGNFLQSYGGHLETNTSNSSVPTSFSFEGWIKPVSTSDFQPIISIGNVQHSYEIGLNGTSLSVDVRYATNSRKVITAGAVPDEVWSKINVSVDEAQIVLKINDVSIFSTSGASPLKSVGNIVRIGKSVNSSTTESFIGELDEISLLVNGSQYILFHLDESRGSTTASDSSGNNLDALLVGGDNKIHFFGVLPSPTPKPTIGISWNRPVLPTLFLPNWFPIRTPLPTSTNPQPTNQPSGPSDNLHDINNRPNLPRN